MNLILLCVSSVFLGRYLERRMRVASIAHSILFIITGFFFLFNSGFEIIDRAMINIVGETPFYEFQEAIVYAGKFYGLGFSALFIMELIVYIILCVAGILAIIKGFKAIIKKFKFNEFKFDESRFVFNLAPVGLQEVNLQGTYLVFAHLRN